MKKTYICPDSEMINLVTENMIATSDGHLDIKPGETDQWSYGKEGWNSEDWSGTADVEE